MGECILQTGGGGLNLKGIVEQYNVYTQEKISAGSFVQFVEGLNGGDEKASVIHAITFNFMQGAGYKSPTKAVLIASTKSTNLFYASVVTFNPLDDTVVLGTTYTRSFDFTNSYAGYSVATLSTDEINGTAFVANIQGADSGGNNHNPSYIAMTVNDSDVVTFGTPVKIAYPVFEGPIFAVNSAVCFSFFSYAGGNPSADSWIQPMTVSGNSISLGAKFVIRSASTAKAGGNNVKAGKIDNVNLVLINQFYKSGMTDSKLLYAYLSFSGMSPTIKSYSDSDTNLNALGKISRLPCGIVALTPSLLVFLGAENSGAKYTGYLQKIIVSESTLSISPPISISDFAVENASYLPLLIARIDSERFLIRDKFSSNEIWLIKVTKLGFEVLDRADTGTDKVSANNVDMVIKIAGERYVIILLNAGGGKSYTRFFKIIGDKILFETLSYTRERQVKKALSRPFDGVAGSAGEGGTRTEIKDTIKIVTL